MNTGKCITVLEITNKNGTECRQEYTVTIPQALCLLFSFSLEIHDCRNERVLDSLHVVELLNCDHHRRICFTGTGNDIQMLFWAKDLFFAAHDWRDKWAVAMIERMFQINGYPAYRRIEGRVQRTPYGHVSNPEKIWLIIMYACGVFDQNDHDAVIELLKPTGRWNNGRFTYQEDILVSLLECKLADPQMSLRDIMQMYGVALAS